MSNDDLPPLSAGVKRIVVNSGKRIAEHRERLFERDTMFPAVCIRLCSIPSKAESHPNGEYHSSGRNGTDALRAG